MNTPASATGRTPVRTWDKVEKSASYFLLFVLLCVLGMRLGFSGVWNVPTLDFVLSAMALVLVLASFWLARNHRAWRLSVIAFASATQLVPMVVREPVLLFPLLGALIPVAILVGCLVALSHKGTNGRP
ncbi:MAG TPA: LrgA [Rhodanobacter sp.]|nr:LrgA [Rhodanobacter sp.]